MQANNLVLGLIVHLLRLCCPYQEDLNSIPVVEFDIADGIDGYRATMGRKKRREKEISPFFVGYHHDIPVTPFLNPRTGLSSHHIIRLTNGGDPRYRVDLLIQDFDLYFVAFRREDVLTGEWGRWQKFKDVKVPEFLNARDIGVKCSYGEIDNIKAGGAITLENIYYTLGRFDDNAVAGDDITSAAYSVMVMFCEPSRLQSMFNEMCRRIRDGSLPSTLRESLWKKIKSWGRLGGVTLDYCVHDQLQANANLPGWCMQEHGFETVEQLVGPRGEVALVKINAAYLGLTHAELGELLKHEGVGNGQDPGFQQN